MAITGSSNFEAGHGSNFSIDGNSVDFDATADGNDVFWFYVKLSGVDGTTPAITVTYSQSPAGSMTGVRPVYSFDQSSWTDVASNWSDPDLSFTIPEISGHDDVWIALTVPYTYTDLLSDISTWESSQFVTVQDLGDSQGGRNIYYLKINDDTSTRRKLQISITCRAHSGEPEASYELKGMIDWLISADSVAQQLRKLAVFHIFPMANPDGVYAGRNRAFNSGTDANRDFDESGPDNNDEEDETYLIHTKIHALNAADALDFHLDIHSYYAEEPNVWRDSAELDSNLETAIEAWLTVYDTEAYYNPAFQQHDNLAQSVNTTWRDGMHDQYSIPTFTTEGKAQGYNGFGYPTMSDIENGGTDMLKAIVRGLVERYLPTGWTWGDATAIPEKPETWDDWEIKETGSDAQNDSSHGDLQLESGDEFVSPVVDLLNTDSKKLSISYNTTNGSGSVHWRGDSSSFNQEDDEVDGPEWEAYTSGTLKTWRYAQVKVTG